MANCHSERDKNVKAAFQLLPDGKKVFNIKMEYLRKKAYLVVGGHLTQMLIAMTYSSMVTTETVFTALSLKALHDI